MQCTTVRQRVQVMSIRLMTLIWDVQFPTQSQLLIALKLADFANDDGGSVYPSRNRLAANCQCSESTVKNTLRAFREIGLLHVVEQGGSGPRDTTRYAWNMRLVKALIDGDCAIKGGAADLEIEWSEAVDNKGVKFDPLEPVRGQSDELRGQSTAAKGVTGYPQPINTHHIDSSARERAGATQTAPAVARPKIVVREGELSWDAWLDAIATRAGEASKMAAEKAGCIIAAGRWPRDDLPLPTITEIKSDGLTDRSRQMVGDGK